ncbi:hypothetical protein M1M25_gp057 [Tenacibaculum phage Gundel_1]|uniref:Uncharacterized protein n=1 Tax=Tenacibaculum phage Gundel_1 TaxID=2745672 RepID=A0A8E4ZDZ5_9CAUD|nr:hypothetical protein M1M25_gp057 [Tenacibaculum phage Gundel_1]QQV91491.1 hypothetical protein Gundel1_57 [Tenacibaculum phage Gundel_1]
MEKTYTLFKSIKPHNAMIVKQPFMVVKRHKSGKDKGKVISRTLSQYNEIMDTISVKEQKEFEDKPMPTALYIRKSQMIVDNDETSKLEAMRMHEDNTANGGKLFREVDIEKEEDFEIEAFELLDAAISVVMDSSASELKTLAIDVIGVHELSTRTSVLKKKLRVLATNNSEIRDKVIAFSKDKSKQERLLTTIALDENIISIHNGKSIAWPDSEEIIYSASQTKDVVNEFSTWLKTDEQGRKVYASLTKKLEGKL